MKRALLRAPLCALALALAGLAGLACGGGAAETTGPEHPVAEPQPLTGASLLPADSFLVAKLDFGRLRESSNWDVVESILMSVEEVAGQANPTLTNGGLRRWVAQADRLHVGMAPSSSPTRPDTAFVVEGRFTVADARTTLTSFQGGPLTFREEAGAAQATFVSDEAATRLVVVRDGLGLGGTGGREAEMVRKEATRNGQGPFDANEALAAIAGRVNYERDAFGVAVVFTPEAKAAIGRVDARIQPVIDAATAGALRVGLDDGIDALAIVTTSDPAVAEAAVAEVHRQRSNYGRQPFVLLLGLGPLVNGVTASAEGGDVRVGLRVGHEDARNILGRASGFVVSMLGELLSRGSL